MTAATSPQGTSARLDVKQESGCSPPNPRAATSPHPLHAAGTVEARREHAKLLALAWTAWDSPHRAGDKADPRAAKAPRAGLSRRQHAAGMRPSEDGAAGPPAAPQPGFLPPNTSHLCARAACAGQALSTVGSSAAMCFELFPPHWLQGPVQALTMHSPEPRPLQEKLSQSYGLGESISQKSLKQGSDLSSAGCASP